jgi:cell division protein FtsL
MEFQNWSIDKGDYKRDKTATWTYQKKLIRKRRIKKILLLILYITILTFATYMVVEGL